MKTWPPVLWVAAVILILIALGIASYMIAMYVIAGVIIGYLVWGGLVTVIFIGITLVLKKTHRVHVHHYTVGMIIIIFIGY